MGRSCSAPRAAAARTFARSTATSPPPAGSGGASRPVAEQPSWARETAADTPRIARGALGAHPRRRRARPLARPPLDERQARCPLSGSSLPSDLDALADLELGQPAEIEQLSHVVLAA